MNDALTQLELDDLKCENPNCTHVDCDLTIHSRCHVKTPTWTKYSKATGVLTIICSLCRKTICSIQVAP